MIEFCKLLAINIFWVLAAAIEVIALLILILGLLFSITGHIHKKDVEE